MKTSCSLEDALERASQGLRKKIEYSVNLLRKAERLALAYDKGNGFYLAFSGGKDSQALYHISELAGVRFKAHMSLTSIDPPEVIRFVKKDYPEVELIAPKKSIYAVAVEKQILPTMRVRWCCAEYKEGAGAGKVTLIGIRNDESSRRAKRNEIEISGRKYSGTLEGLDEYRDEQRKKKNAKGTNITNATEESTAGCINGKESLLVSPIIHWTERDVWEFLNNVVKVEHCCLYDEGYKRLGCILCPMSPPKQKSKEMLRWPHVKRNWIKAIKAIRMGGGFKKNTYGGTCRTRELPPTQQYKFLSESHLDSDSPRHIQSEVYGISDKVMYATDVNWNEMPFSESPVSSGEVTGPKVFTEDEIAESVFDWWISGKGYEKWFAERFLQLKLFDSENEQTR